VAALRIHLIWQEIWKILKAREFRNSALHMRKKKPIDTKFFEDNNIPNVSNEELRKWTLVKTKHHAGWRKSYLHSEHGEFKSIREAQQTILNMFNELPTCTASRIQFGEHSTWDDCCAFMQSWVISSIAKIPDSSRRERVFDRIYDWISINTSPMTARRFLSGYVDHERHLIGEDAKYSNRFEPTGIF
jgi:hypothetical protein